MVSLFVFCLVYLSSLDRVAACPFTFGHNTFSAAFSESEKLAHICFATDISQSDSSAVLDFYIEMEHPGGKPADETASHEEFRILCFGDSLTAGYMLTSANHFPYGDAMQTDLAKLLSLPLSKVHVDIDGLSGETCDLCKL